MKRRGFVSRGAAAANSRHVRCIRGGRRSYMKRRGFVSRGGGGSEHQARPPYSRLPALQGTGMRGGFCRSAGRREHGHGALAHAECRTAAFAARAAPARTGKHHGVQMRSRPFPFLRRLTIMRALSGPIAQLGERCVRNAEVGSSILLRSTKNSSSEQRTTLQSVVRCFAFGSPKRRLGSGNERCQRPQPSRHIASV